MWILTYSILVRLLSTLWGDEEEELFAVAAVQLPKVVAEAEIDEIFSQAAVLAEQRTGRSYPQLLQRFQKVQCHSSYH